jgi:mono/diheme cytochrome c family protein
MLGLAGFALGAQVFAENPHARARDARWIAPGDATMRANPLADRPETLAGGQRLFDQRCASCHHDDGHGSRRAPDLTSPAVQAQSDGALFWKISSGHTRGGMPSFSFLPGPQRWQLVLQVRALAQPSVAAPPDVKR